MRISIAYHWSPTKNREAILQDGLKIMMSEMKYVNPVTKKYETWKPPYICMSPEPRTALTYVKPMFPEGMPSMDLYEIIILHTDTVDIRNDGTNEVIELRVLNTIPPDRIIYLATLE